MYSIFESLLEKHGVTAYKVAKATGITTSPLTSWKQGKYVPKPDKLQKIADYFGVSLGYLMGTEEAEPNAIDKEKNPIVLDDEALELLEELKTYNTFEWNADRETIISWSSTEGYPTDATYSKETGYNELVVNETYEYETESLAKFAFSILWQAAEFSMHHGVVIVFDF